MFSNVSGPAPTGKSDLTAVENNIEVYAMPGKFLPERPDQTKSRSGLRRMIVMASLVLALLTALVAGAIFYLSSSVKRATDTSTVALTNNTNAVPEQNATNSISNNIQPPDNTNSISNEVPPVSTSTPPDTLPPAEDLDADKDGLTVAEEALFLTNIARDDTDRDGYKDGQELVNLFNPLVPGQALENSGLVTRYKNDRFAYNLLLPQSWLASAANTDQSEIMFLTDAETGEFINLSVSVNTGGQNLAVLRSTYFLPSEQTENFQVAGRSALRTPLKVLWLTEQYIYVLEYRQNQATQPSYPAVWEMMLKSFQITSKVELETEPPE